MRLLTSPGAMKPPSHKWKSWIAKATKIFMKLKGTRTRARTRQRNALLNCGLDHPLQPRRKCPAYLSVCLNCQKENHWARVCRSRNQGRSRLAKEHSISSRPVALKAKLDTGAQGNIYLPQNTNNNEIKQNSNTKANKSGEEAQKKPWGL